MEATGNISKELKARLDEAGWTEQTLQENKEKGREVLEALFIKRDELLKVMELVHQLDESPIGQTFEYLVHQPGNPDIHKIYSNKDLIEQIKLELGRTEEDIMNVIQIVDKGYLEEEDNGCPKCPKKK